MIKGKILFLVTLLVALVLTAASALVGYVAATELAVVFEQSLLAFDWDTIKIICAAICGGLMLIIPGLATDIGGFGLIAIVAVLQILARKKAPAQISA